MALPSAHDLVVSIKDLPSPPSIYLKLAELIQRDAWNAREVAGLIGADPALASRLLRLANSPFYAMPRTVSDLDEAVVLLGQSEIRTLVLATAVLERFKGIPAGLVGTESLRRRSLYSSLSSAHLAVAAGFGTGRSELFLSGLVFDIGSLVICLQLPEAVQEAWHGGRIPYEDGGPSIECAVTGSNLALVAGELLDRWRLPASVVEAVRWARIPREAQHYRQRAALVHLGSRLSAPLARGLHQAAAELVLDDEVRAAAGLPSGCLATVVDRVTAEFETLERSLAEPRRPG